MTEEEFTKGNQLALSMDDAAAKLRDRKVTEKIAPSTDEHFCVFASYLADRLDGQTLVPMGFALAMQLAIYDLGKGVNGFDGKPIKNKLVGMPSMVHRMMLLLLYRRLTEILPEDFADEVLKIDAKVNA